MSLTVNLPADVMRRLELEAGRRGISLDALVAQLMAELADRLPSGNEQHADTPAGGDDFFGFVPFPKRGGRVTNDIIDQLRDELAV